MQRIRYNNVRSDIQRKRERERVREREEGGIDYAAKSDQNNSTKRRKSAKKFLTLEYL